MSDNQKMQWYTLHVYSSMEKSVVKALEERIARSELRDSFGQVLLPIERIQEVCLHSDGDERRHLASG